MGYMYRNIAIIAAFAILLLAFGCTSQKGTNAQGGIANNNSGSNGAVLSNSSVDIRNFAFSPAEIHVKAGTTVTWTNHDDAPHTVTADDNSFGSSTMPTNGAFFHTFDAPGTYPYHCAIHTGMKGKVIVE